MLASIILSFYLNINGNFYHIKQTIDSDSDKARMITNPVPTSSIQVSRFFLRIGGYLV